MESTWDAGELGCVRFVMALRRHVDALEPGGRLRLVARDPGAAADLHAWCRMTGHRLVEAAPPVFVVERKAGGSGRTADRATTPE